jgi:hypothetical protein
MRTHVRYANAVECENSCFAFVIGDSYSRETVMKRLVAPILFSLVLVLATSAMAQPPSAAPPTKEHEWLAQFVGEWDSESEAVAGPGQPAIKCKGAMTSKKLGGFWVVNDLTGNMMGTEMHGLQTIGYDPEKKKYIGTWVDNMMGHMWKYEGAVDSSGKKLVLEAEGPSMFEPGKTAKYRDSYEFKSADHVVAVSEMQDDKGQWVQFMKGDVKRRKK